MWSDLYRRIVAEPRTMSASSSSRRRSFWSHNVHAPGWSTRSRTAWPRSNHEFGRKLRTAGHSRSESFQCHLFLLGDICSHGSHYPADNPPPRTTHWIRPLPRHQRHSRQLRGDVSRQRPQRQGRGDEGVSRHRLHGSDPTGSRSATFRRRRRRTRIHPTRSSVRLWRHTGPDTRPRKSTERQSNVPDKLRLESELRARFVYSYPVHVVVFVRELCWHRHAACSLLRKKILGHPADRGHITECFHKTGCGNSKPPMCLTLISTESFIPI